MATVWGTPKETGNSDVVISQKRNSPTLIKGGYFVRATSDGGMTIAFPSDLGNNSILGVTIGVDEVATSNGSYQEVVASSLRSTVRLKSGDTCNAGQLLYLHTDGTATVTPPAEDIIIVGTSVTSGANGSVDIRFSAI